MIATYNGNEPYVFVSYAHKDSASVFPLIEGLQLRGFRVWYDSGIEVGTEWPQYIAERIDGAACVVAFISRASIDSHNCRREINFAIELKKEVLAIYLEEFDLPLGMRMQLGTLQAMFRSRYTDDAPFLDALEGAKLLQVCRADAGQTGLTAEQRAEALYMEARRYFGGVEAPQDLPRAAALFRQAGDLGHAPSQYILGMCYENGRGVPHDVGQAAYWFRRAAEGGDADAQYNIGFYHENGHGCPRDMFLAVQWYRRAAESGNVRAQFNLAYCYEKGEGCEVDTAAALEWYSKAAAQGHTAAAAAYTRLSEAVEETV